MNYIVQFEQLDQNSIPIAGGKGANLGEMTSAGFPVPPGFVLTTEAYDAFVDTNNLQQQILALAQTVSLNDPQSSETASAQIRALFMQGVIADELKTALTDAYRPFQVNKNAVNAVAVRSSATAEDLPTASFAGQQDTFLNIQGEEALLDAVKQCWASLWTARAIVYRMRQSIDPAAVSLAVIVQQLIPADAAGVLFTANPL
ncbi:MAG: PEP/pyruvate-binding domain-containing protein, partial [Chloroflexota bacterium]